MGGSHWVVWRKELTEENIRSRYFEMTGRGPDLIHSPEESKTPFWWTGWVNKKEYYAFKEKEEHND